MYFRKFTILVTATLIAGSTSAVVPPTMGWSTWNTFALNINEKVIKDQADAMVKTGLKKAGYQYVNIDDGYWDGRGADGNLRLNTTLFPNGMRYLTDYIHSLGLKAGIYSDAGDNTCGSRNKYAWGLGVGFYGHEQQDCNLYFNDWNFDFIKVDYCGGRNAKLNEQAQYTKIGNAIKQTKKPNAQYNICRWAFPGTWASQIATSWRTTGDIRSNWQSLYKIIRENRYLSAFAGGGHYNDMDMLEIGRTLSPDEEITHMAVWCMLSSPLLIGCDMSQIPEFSLNLLKNSELIAINQDALGIGAPVVQRQGDVYVFAKDLKKVRGKERAVCITNLSDQEQTIDVVLTNIGYDGNIALRDVVNHQQFAASVNGSFKVTVPAHGSQVFVATGANRCEPKKYEAEQAWMKCYQELTGDKTANYVPKEGASNGVVVNDLGNNKDNYMEWKHVYSKKGGDYEMTVKYICGENRQLAISVNGNTPQMENVAGTNWETVNSKTVRIKLNKGMNSIKLGEQDTWAPDIDCIELNAI